MRRMITSKQAESLDKLNQAIEVTKIEGGDNYVTLKTDSVFMEGDYPFYGFDQYDDTEVWGYIGTDGDMFSVGVTDDCASYGEWGIDFLNGVNITHEGDEVAKFSDNIILTAHEQYSERSFTIDPYGIKSPIDDGNTLVFGLNFDGDAGGMDWTSEPGAGYQVSSNGDLYVYGNDVSLHANNTLKIINLPTSDPHVAGALWNDNGTLKISSGN